MFRCRGARGGDASHHRCCRLIRGSDQVNRTHRAAGLHSPLVGQPPGLALGPRRINLHSGPSGAPAPSASGPVASRSRHLAVGPDRQVPTRDPPRCDGLHSLRGPLQVRGPATHARSRALPRTCPVSLRSVSPIEGSLARSARRQDRGITSRIGAAGSQRLSDAAQTPRSTTDGASPLGPIHSLSFLDLCRTVQYDRTYVRLTEYRLIGRGPWQVGLPHTGERSWASSTNYKPPKPRCTPPLACSIPSDSTARTRWSCSIASPAASDCAPPAARLSHGAPLTAGDGGRPDIAPRRTGWPRVMARRSARRPPHWKPATDCRSSRSSHRLSVRGGFRNRRPGRSPPPSPPLPAVKRRSSKRPNGTAGRGFATLAAGSPPRPQVKKPNPAYEQSTVADTSRSGRTTTEPPV